jgi:hypothetical protein
MKTAPFLRAGILWLALGSPVLATTYGSVEPIATPDVIDTGILRAQRLDVRAAFAGLLDAVNTGSFDFPANYVVLNFETPPPLRTSAALFEAVGRIDPNCSRPTAAVSRSTAARICRFNRSSPTVSSSQATFRRPQSSASNTHPSSRVSRHSLREAPRSRAITGSSFQVVRNTWREFQPRTIRR